MTLLCWAWQPLHNDQVALYDALYAGGFFEIGQRGFKICLEVVSILGAAVRQRVEGVDQDVVRLSMARIEAVEP